MTAAAADPVPSGQPHDVLAVSGRQPTTIDDFVGSELTVLIGATTGQATSGATTAQVVSGTGARDGVDVRFHEKHDTSGNDVRVWRISAGPDGAGFTAASV